MVLLISLSSDLICLWSRQLARKVRSSLYNFQLQLTMLQDPSAVGFTNISFAAQV